ncbi:hypothetical protein [Sphingomonas cavernae]|uniref:Uncharacterized protein n=1 Tax=Sphingomonas cavernae TaxID=2320861 RepID=A0A418WP64_9SPHN|nr:hypothetical protein [Sphingomonas cavernae]RJF93013.1 hypothetical protein D3876_01095 [Sphingomonas cavernae]
MSTEPEAAPDPRVEAIAGHITAGIYSAPLAQATARQRTLALSVADKIVAAEQPPKAVWIGYDPSSEAAVEGIREAIRNAKGPGKFRNLFLHAPEPASPAAEITRYRNGLIAIQKACANGRICDDVAWFDDITTLHDFIEELLSPSAPAVVADLFEGPRA